MEKSRKPASSPHLVERGDVVDVSGAGEREPGLMEEVNIGFQKEPAAPESNQRLEIQWGVNRRNGRKGGMGEM
jgi:hypothetical protein